MEEEVQQNEQPLGKFKNETALAEAYKNLQAEFTRKCQRIKELEENKAGSTTADGQTETAAAEQTLSADDAPVFNNQTAKDYSAESAQSDDPLSAYVRILEEGRPVAQSSVAASPKLLGEGGAMITAPPMRPKTIEEAGKLARALLQKK